MSNSIAMSAISPAVVVAVPKFEITKEIGIDAAHRVALHESKCKNLHGHRYTIQVTIDGELAPMGAQSGMVMDFAFLKDLMMEHIDTNCDHGLIVDIADSLVIPTIFEESKYWFVRCQVERHGALCTKSLFGKTYVVLFTPTAENLARHWYELLAGDVHVRSQGRARIKRVRVFETPTSYCDFPSLS